MTNYTETLFLPKTDFPLRANAAVKEPELIKRWTDSGLYWKRRDQPDHDTIFTLHDGPPYANGHIHIGHALNKVLKDIVVRSRQMMGYDTRFVPGWDCHGLPIEWNVEREYLAEGRAKDAVPVIEFRQRCRAYARKWVDIQKAEFQRLGICADWDNAYETMSFNAEAQIAREIMKFAANGLLYRGSKPVLWSIAEGTSLSEAEVEYRDHQSDTVYVCFKLRDPPEALAGARLIAYTTTPWTLPANRAVAYNGKIDYGLYRVVQAPEGNWAKPDQLFIVADKLAASTFGAAKVSEYVRVQSVSAQDLSGLTARHPLEQFGFFDDVPLLEGDHVTDDTGTGLVHTAPSHGREDYDLWMANTVLLRDRGIDPTIPHCVGPDGAFTNEAGLLRGVFVFTADGKPGKANSTVIDLLSQQGAIIARGRVKHAYPHSWRSKTPLIHRNTPQWFIAMDKAYAARANGGYTLRGQALHEIKNEVDWHPKSGAKRIANMVETRPDWVVSRQRVWGVPICVFARPNGEILVDPAINKAIADAFAQEGADCWFADGARERFLGDRAQEDWHKVDDVLDVWFDSGCTHTFETETKTGSILYLEGSDQHRGWFQSSLLESVATRGLAPYDDVLTHGFVLDEKGKKMSKSEGNVIAPQDVIDTASADILRLWVASSDYQDDIRVGKKVLSTFTDTYRKIRNTMRWMIGALAHAKRPTQFPIAPNELDLFILHRLVQIGSQVEEAYAEYDFKRVVATLSLFMNAELSAFYFDVRKDALYCDPPSSDRRRYALLTIGYIFRAVVAWLAPILPFLAEEAWHAVGTDVPIQDPRTGLDDSIHLLEFSSFRGWHRPTLALKWEGILKVRARVMAELEKARASKLIGSSLEARIYIKIFDHTLYETIANTDWEEVCIVSAAVLVYEDQPTDNDGPIAVYVDRAIGQKCARSWKYSTEVGSDPEFPDVTPRDAKALREIRELTVEALL